MAERKNLTVTEVKEIQRFGADNQGQKLSFKARDGDTELLYITYKRSFFDKIKQGETISADVEVSTREWEGQTYTDRKIVQIYVDGQPVSSKGTQYRGKSPEELEQQARVMVLSYAKDLAVAQLISLEEITKTADRFYTWLKINDKITSPPMTESKPPKDDKIDLKKLDFKNPGEFYTACKDHFNLLKSRVDAEIPEFDLSKADQRKKAWGTIIAIYGQKPE